MWNEEKIIEDCKKQSKTAQRLLYEKYSPLLLGICVRYASDINEAEDILQDAFVKIFFNIKNFNGLGSFEGWLKRIVVNTAITNYHRTKKYRYHQDIDDMHERLDSNYSIDGADFNKEELFGVIRSLPDGYKMVFNLYAIEGYKHKEIAEQLNIDINTSKSQYSRAKALIRARLEVLSREKISKEQ